MPAAGKIWLGIFAENESGGSHRSLTHCQPVMAAIYAGKHIYCEWPLGREIAEALRMLGAAERRGVRHAIATAMSAGY